MLAEESNKEFGWDGCHLKITCHIDMLFHVHILEVYVQICVRYEDSIIKAINGTAVHRQHQQWWQWCQWRWQHHTMDKSWLHRLTGMYAKWDKKLKCSVCHHYRFLLCLAISHYSDWSNLDISGYFSHQEIRIRLLLFKRQTMVLCCCISRCEFTVYFVFLCKEINRNTHYSGRVVICLTPGGN